MQIYDITIQNMFNNPKYSNNYLFYACILSKCTLIIDNKMDSPAAVSFDKVYNLYINMDLFSTYTLEQRLAILKHEMLHILNGHLTIRSLSGENANIAFDCAINQLIDKEHLPENCITVQYVQKLLTDNNININVKYNESSEYYYQLLNKIPKNKAESNINNHNWFNSETDGTDETINNITYDIIEEAIETTNSIIGNKSNNYEKWLDLFNTKSKINWKRYLKVQIKNFYKKSVFKRNRRLPNRLDLNGKVRNKKTNILYIIDSSGSVSDKEFKKLNSEIISIFNQLNVNITAIQVDSEASEPEILSKNTKKINRTKNAGTFLSAGLLKAAEHKIKYDSVLVSTDGFLHQNDIDEFVKINKKIIFLITNKGVDNFTKLKNKNIKCIKMENN